MTFKGYKRPDGSVGIRNKVVVMAGVLCADIAVKKICEQVPEATYVYNPYGCGQAYQDQDETIRVLSGHIANGNVYGALVVGLGCEGATKKNWTDAINARTNKPWSYLSIQEEGLEGVIEKGVKYVKGLVEEAKKQERVDCDFSDIIMGLECGGSDPTSGASANVVLGYVSDKILGMGGTTIISEVSEAIGCENVLANRGKTPEISEQLVKMVKDWDENMYNETGINVRAMNPSPGNKKGGLTTLAEKSLGCLHKAGQAPFEGILEPGEAPKCKGLWYERTIAYDVASTAAKTGSGAQLVVFTTGLGNPMGNPVSSVVKVTGNKFTYDKLSSFIDLETSATIYGEKTIEQRGEEMFEFIKRVCEGEETKAEQLGSEIVSINQRHCGP